MLLYRKHKKFDGEIALLYLGGYGLGRAWIEGIRTDQLFLPGTEIPVSQLLAVILFAGAVVCDAAVRIRKRKNGKEIAMIEHYKKPSVKFIVNKGNFNKLMALLAFQEENIVTEEWKENRQ